ncbi:hypothetical protein [Streptomyces demainii]|uniref:DUF4240 domain-containing protein n=1 Tax=Streptomyces demainii TaxID=588122 RepID=A0ABT9KWP0_9ACTN|nr:hypothetical protein [Streptomyces demainii]MDP9612850.1 hypothetical protein [Streptomyces demainii]
MSGAFRAWWVSQLGLGSTNGTRSSRLALEFGVWLDDPELLTGVRQSLVKLMPSSENIDPDDDLFDSECVNVGYDDEAFCDAMCDSSDVPAEDDE